MIVFRHETLVASRLPFPPRADSFLSLLIFLPTTRLGARGRARGSPSTRAAEIVAAAARLSADTARATTSDWPDLELKHEQKKKE